MAIARPYRRTVLQFADAQYSEGGRSQYISHPKFAIHPSHFTRSYQIILKDMIEIFDFIEPSDINLNAYSFRLHGLLMRICIEVEANFKAIMSENGYTKSGNWNMEDYKKTEKSHFLSEYYAKYPVWMGSNDIRRPFAEFASGNSPQWYKDYHAAKHDRHNEFTKANFANVIDAMAGLTILLHAQFMNEDFVSTPVLALESHGAADGFDSAIGDYLRVKQPQNVPVDSRYDFRWLDIAGDADPFVNFNY